MFQEKQLSIIEDERGLSVELSWYKPKAIFLGAFCAIWFSSLLMFYGVAGFTGAPVSFFLFPLIHVVVGLWVAYFTLCLFFNKTYLDVSPEHLWVHHGPIPWWQGNVDLPTSELDQVYVKEKVTTNNNSASLSYQLMARLKNGTTRKLIDIDHTNSEQMLRLEELIEDYLNITDRQIPGAYHTLGSRRRKKQTKELPPAATYKDKLNLEDEPTMDLDPPPKEPLKDWDREDLV
ncbi:MAG: hypothetical protein D6772_07925 [Bacteroidetes bacterium]|nr:MAG: hypothetical protein D6772_07925 [Bacteroidota bacterium]